MKLISWNVNGILACLKKGFMEYFEAQDADIFCLQETKCSAGQVELDLKGYYQYWNYAVKKGYSGTAIFTKKEPLSVSYGLGIEEHDQEGRVICLEFEDFYMITVYTPNSKNELERLDYRMVWEDEFRKYLSKLKVRRGADPAAARPVRRGDQGRRAVSGHLRQGALLPRADGPRAGDRAPGPRRAARDRPQARHPAAGHQRLALHLRGAV